MLSPFTNHFTGCGNKGSQQKPCLSRKISLCKTAELSRIKTLQAAPRNADTTTVSSRSRKYQWSRVHHWKKWIRMRWRLRSSDGLRLLLHTLDKSVANLVAPGVVLIIVTREALAAEKGKPLLPSDVYDVEIFFVYVCDEVNLQ